MDKSKNKYPLNQSPLYKINSHQKLAKILGIEIATLRNISKIERVNYYFSEIPSSKPDKPPRKLEVPLPQLKRIHSRINNLLSRITPPDYLNSGIKGRSNVANARAHIGEKALIKIDIKDFYVSTTIEMVERCFIDTFQCVNDVAKTLAGLCCVNGHLPTGSPISQSVSFYVNLPIFNHLQIYSKYRAIEFSVYVDDLTFSGKQIPKHFLDYVTSYIKKTRGYKCHKIRKYNAKTPKPVTGAIIDGDVLKVNSKHTKVISELLKSNEEKIANHAHDSDELKRHFQVLIGHLFSAGQINGRYYQLGKKMLAYRNEHDIKGFNKKSSKKTRVVKVTRTGRKTYRLVTRKTDRVITNPITS
jgi:hypothetical protein